MIISPLINSAYSIKPPFGWWGNYYTNQAYPGDYEGPRSHRNYIPRRPFCTDLTVAEYERWKRLAEKGLDFAKYMLQKYF